MGCNASKQEGYEGPDQGSAANLEDPKKSAALKAEALKVADEMMAQTRGRRFHEFYTRLTLTSYGASCKVLTAYHRTTNKKVAVKTIPKSRKQLERQRQKVKLEIGTFRMVEDHPNAVKVLEIFEGAECYYIVMECCEGGELFDHISKKQGCFTERQAAHLLRSLMLFLAHMHSKGIAHLDIKPENIMFDSEGATGVLKVLDFGSSVFVQPNETVRNAFGTVRYASPEMANDVCGQKADIWSAGVVMYILLCGRAPFLKSNDIDTLNLIKSGPRVKFNGERWAAMSQSAKDCIKALLEPSPRLRPTAVEVLAMPWLKQQVPETVIRPDTLQHLRTFANQSRIRRLLLGLMADQLVGSGANQLLGQFYSLDKDFSGTLEISELVKAAKEAIPELTEVEINRMFEALDVDHTGTVDVKEFFAGLIQTIDEEKQTLVAQKSFTMLDKRGAGFVTKEAFMEVLLERAQAGCLRGLTPKQDSAQDQQQFDQGVEPRWHGRHSGADGGDAQVILDPGLVSELEAEFANLDANGDGVLSFEEFKAILGIQSTPEGLTLAQPQLVAVPSIQEGVESIVRQTVARTRTVSISKLEDQGRRAGSVTHAHPPRVSNGGGGGAGGGGGGQTGRGGNRDITSAGGGGYSAGGGGARASSAGSVGMAAVSVDRAQLDLELPYDLETRELLQILAPAKRTASQAPAFATSVGGGGSRAVSGGTAAGGGTAVGRCPSTRELAARGAVAALIQRATSMGPAHATSAAANAPTMLLLDKAPSMRAPSLPPLPLRNSMEPCDPPAAAAAAGGAGGGGGYGYSSSKERAWEGLFDVEGLGGVGGGSVQGSGSSGVRQGNGRGGVAVVENTCCPGSPQGQSPRSSACRMSRASSSNLNSSPSSSFGPKPKSVVYGSAGGRSGNGTAGWQLPGSPSAATTAAAVTAAAAASGRPDAAPLLAGVVGSSSEGATRRVAASSAVA